MPLPAPIWRRFAALLYDSFILLAISMLYGALTSALYVAVNGPGNGDYSPMMGGPLFLTGWAISLQFFYVFFWYRAGQTVGMRAWRIKLVGTQNPKPRLHHCILRSCIAPVSFAILGLGYFWAWLDKNRDCAHDKLSKTRVLFTPKPQKNPKQ